MKYIKLFENHSQDQRGYGYYNLSNAYTEGILDELDELKKEAGNYVSFYYKYDGMSNFIEIEVMGDNWFNRIIDIVEKHRGIYNGWDKLKDDAMSIMPMKFH